MTGELIFDMEDEKAASVARKIRAGHITDVSIGYEVIKQTHVAPRQTANVSGRSYTAGEHGLNVVTAWRAKEISPTPIGADQAAKIRESAARSAGFSSVEEAERSTQTQTQKKQTMSNNTGAEAPSAGEQQAAPVSSAPEVRSASITATPANDHDRIREIQALGSRFKLPEADIAIAELDGVSVEAFRKQISAQMKERAAAESIESAPEIGLTRKERGAFSIRKALHDLRFRGGLQGFEKEVSLATAERYDLDRSPNSIHLPHDVMSHRDLEAGVAGEGGNLVATDLSGSMIDILRNRLVTVDAGAQMMTGLQGNIAISKLSASASAAWIDEEGVTADSAQTFAQVTMSPQRLSARTLFSDLLVRQSSQSVENIVRDDLMKLIATEIDRTVIHGSGVAPEPLGVEGSSGVNNVTFTTSATWAKVLDFEELIAADNADFGTMTWITTPAVRAAWKATEKATGTAQFLWAPDNTVNGYRAIVTNQIASNKVAFGNWASAMIGSWGGQTITLDNISLAASGQFALTISGFYDVAVRYGESFTFSTDSGAL
jgi:HK97 family phage major capsid protein